MDEIAPSFAAHWLHFERVDIPSDAPPIQRDAMRQAFYAGAASGLLLGISAYRKDDPKAEILRLNSEVSTFGAITKATMP